MKQKYYFKKPKSEIVKDALAWLGLAGTISIAVTSPYFLINLCRGYQRWGKYKGKKVSDAFYRLRKSGDIKIEKRGQQIYISLTKKGKKKAGWFQVDDLKIAKPRKWDGKWRMVIYDIAHLKKLYREALRGKLKELGFYPLQKSVWVNPFDCRDEIGLLKEFFGLNDKELRLVITRELGENRELKKFFEL